MFLTTPDWVQVCSRFAVIGLCGAALAACSTSRFGSSQQPSYLTPPPARTAQPMQQPAYQAPVRRSYQQPAQPIYQRSGPVTGYQSHGGMITVARGDTLFSLSRRHGVTVSSLMAENRLPNTVLSVGQRLRLPVQR